MPKLKLEHIATYLPYNVKIQYKHKEDGLEFGITNLTDRFYNMPTAILDNFILYLKPLSELKYDDNFWNEFYIEFGGGYKNIKQFKKSWGIEILLDPLSLGYKYYKFVLKLHYDVFGLIEKGLAKNVSELES